MDKLLKLKHSWVILVAAAVVVVLLSAGISARFDLTAENRYTLSPAMQKILAQLDEPVEVTLLLAGNELPAGFKRLAQSTERFLTDCAAESNGRLSWQSALPDDFLADSEKFPISDTFKNNFLKSQAVKQTEVTSSGTKAVFNYPVALVRKGEAFTAVNLLSGQGQTGFMNPAATDLQFEVINNAEAQLEYQFGYALRQLTRSLPPTVAYATGHGEPTGPETFDLSSTLGNQYRFYSFNLKEQPFISDSIQALVIAKPTATFAAEEKMKIDQYLMRGGAILFFLDVLHADMDSLVKSGSQFTAYPRSLNLDDLLFRYGARINYNLVQDLQSDMLPQKVGMVGDQPQIELLPWPYFPLLYPKTNHPIVKSLDAVVMQFPNSIDTVEADGIAKKVLLSSSNTSRLLGAPAIVTVEILKQTDNAAAWRQNDLPLAVLLEGNFKSLFANRVSAAQKDSLAAFGVPFRSQSSQQGKVIITGDGDWVLNGLSQQGPLEMGTNPYTRYSFANKNLLLNMLDYLTDETGIMQARGKIFVLRRLNPKALDHNKAAWQWLNIAGPLVMVSLVWLVFWWRRKSQNEKPA